MRHTAAAAWRGHLPHKETRQSRTSHFPSTMISPVHCPAQPMSRPALACHPLPGSDLALQPRRAVLRCACPDGCDASGSSAVRDAGSDRRQDVPPLATPATSSRSSNASLSRRRLGAAALSTAAAAAAGGLQSALAPPALAAAASPASPAAKQQLRELKVRCPHCAPHFHLRLMYPASY